MYTIETLYEILVDFNLVVAKVDRQIAKFNSPPNFLAIHHLPPTTPTPHPHTQFNDDFFESIIRLQFV